MIEGAVFIGAVVIAVVEAIKSIAPGVGGALTVLVAALVGLLVSLIDTSIGVVNLSVAQGVMTGLAAAGTVTVAKKI